MSTAPTPQAETRKTFEGVLVRVFTAQRPMLVGKAFYRLVNRRDAEDVVQEAFTRVLSSCQISVSEDELQRLLWVVLIRVAREFNRRERNQGKRKDALIAQGPRTLAQEVDSVDILDDAIVIWREAAKLPDELRVPFELRYKHGRSCEEIALLLEMSKRTVEKRLERAKAIVLYAMEHPPERSTT